MSLIHRHLHLSHACESLVSTLSQFLQRAFVVRVSIFMIGCSQSGKTVNLGVDGNLRGLRSILTA